MSFVCLNSILKGYIQDLSSFQSGQNSSQFLFLKAFLHLVVVGSLRLLACEEVYAFVIAIAPFDVLKMSSPWPRTEKHRNTWALPGAYTGYHSRQYEEKVFPWTEAVVQKGLCFITPEEWILEGFPVSFIEVSDIWACYGTHCIFPPLDWFLHIQYITQNGVQNLKQN